MKVVTFKILGRFGNNLFQYFAAELIKKIYTFDVVRIYTGTPDRAFPYVVDDKIFMDIVYRYLRGHPFPIHTNFIILDGFFQRAEIFSFFSDFIKSKFTSENTAYINERYRICDIVNHVPKHQVDEDDLVLHLRLDDFMMYVNDSHIIDPKTLSRHIQAIPHKNLYIVCDKLKHPWEHKYMDLFKDVNYTLIQGELLDDFKVLMSAKKLILSNSTFAWMAAYLGDAHEVHMPSHKRYLEGHQNLGPFKNTCKLYLDTVFWNDI